MNNRELVVKGIGKTSAAPDLIVLAMEVEANEKDYEKTMRRAEDMLESLRAAITSAGHDSKKLKTASFNINTKYESYNESNAWKQRFAGYTCSHSLRLEFDLDMPTLGTTLGAIAVCDAKPEFSIKFTVKDTNAVSERLLESAIENARSKAVVLAKAAGVTLGAIQRIDYNWSDVHFHSKTEMMVCESTPYRAASAPAPMSLNIEPEEINVSDTATVVWEIS